MMINYHSKSIEDAQSDLEVSISSGLSSAEAQKRIEKFGENKLNEKPKKKKHNRKKLSKNKMTKLFTVVFANVLILK